MTTWNNGILYFDTNVNNTATPGGFLFRSNGSTTSIMSMLPDGNVGIGVNDPDAKLEVSGQIKITGGVPGANKVLTSDANGLATWETPGTGADDLGDHIATQKLDLGANKLVGNGGTNGIYIDSSGQIAVGTSSPDASLHIVDGGTTHPALFIEGASSTEGDIAWADGENFQLGEWNIATDTFDLHMSINADGTVKIENEIEFVGSAASSGNAMLQKNQTTGRDELQVYSTSDAYGTGSKGAGIHIYGNNDDEHSGNISFMTGNNDAGDARLIIAGGGGGTTVGNRNLTDTRITIGNSIFDYVDTRQDTAMLTLKDHSGHPAINITGASSSEGDIAVPDGEAISFGHWNGATTTFTSRMHLTSSGTLGIGTTSPAADLEIDDIYSGYPALLLNGKSATELDIAVPATDSMQFGHHDGTTNGGTTRMVISSAGYVGIGTSSPSEKLEVSGSIMLDDGTTGEHSLYTNAASNSSLKLSAGGITGGASITLHDKNHATYPGNMYLTSGYGGAYGDIYFRNHNGTAATNHMVIKSNGRIGMGTTTTSYKLQVYDNVSSAYVAYFKNTNAGTSHGVLIDAGANNTASFPLMVRRYGGGTNLFYVRGDGNYYHAGSAISTKESKKNVQNFDESAMSLLRNINVVSYKYKQDADERPDRIGFIANDENYVYDDRLTNKKSGFDVNTIVGVMIKSLQELESSIDENKLKFETMQGLHFQVDENTRKIASLEEENKKIKEELKQLKNLIKKVLDQK